MGVVVLYRTECILCMQVYAFQADTIISMLLLDVGVLAGPNQAN